MATKKLSAAERNRRKRERRKQTRAIFNADHVAVKDNNNNNNDSKLLDDDVEIVYVTDDPMTMNTVTAIATDTANTSPPSSSSSSSLSVVNVDVNVDKMMELEEAMKKFHQRAGIDVPSTAAAADVDAKDSAVKDNMNESDDDDDDDDDEKENTTHLSRKKLREKMRPSIGVLKQRVKRPDLVEAHDVTAQDPDFLIEMKGVPGTVPIPRHWGRKRKYLQGKRGIEKPPFGLPDFIVKTGIMEIRGAVQEDQSKMSLKQKQRARVAPKGGGEVDYRVLHDAFFRYQTKPSLTKFGELYYEGKEFEQDSSKFKPGVMSEELRTALGMLVEGSTVPIPPPFLLNMQRYGPPPAYPNLKVPGVNAELPAGASYGYHKNGWGKPPLDVYGRPLYGGDPFGNAIEGEEDQNGNLVSSDGKTVGRAPWGVLPTADDFFEEDDESSEEEMEESSDDEEDDEEEIEEGEATETPSHTDAVKGFPPLPEGGMETPAVLDLRKATGEETPMPSSGPKQLYSILEQTAANKDSQQREMFSSDVAYVMPGQQLPAEGAESVLSKAVSTEDANKRKRRFDDEDGADLEKKFKF